MQQGDSEFVGLLERLDDRKDRIESTRHTKIRVRQWLDKLCEPMSSLEWRRNRNAYARLLIKQLDEGELSEPFIKVPDAGPLRTLPGYLLVRAPKSPTYKVVSSPRGRAHGEGFGNLGQREGRLPRHPGRQSLGHESKFAATQVPVYAYEDDNDDFARENSTANGLRPRVSSISSSSSSMASSLCGGVQNEASYWRKRAESAEKQARILAAQLERAEAEVETERAMRAKEKRRLRQLHEAEIEELQRLHANELDQLEGGRLDLDDDPDGDLEALERSLSLGGGGGASTGRESKYEGPEAAEGEDLDSSAFLEYLAQFEASTARLIQNDN